MWGDSLRKGASCETVVVRHWTSMLAAPLPLAMAQNLCATGGRPGAALYVGGMGARSKNFYNDIFAKSGYEAEAKIIQDLYLSGDKKAAEAAIPEDYLAKSSLIGPEGFVKERLYALRESGVTSLNVSFVGTDAAQRTAQCEALRNLVDSL